MVDDGRRTDGRRTDGRTPDHGHPISSPCEPDGSGELKSRVHRRTTVLISKDPMWKISETPNNLSQIYNALTA